MFGRMADFGERTGRRLMTASDNEKSGVWTRPARAGWLYFIAGHTQDEIARC